jgi:CheY-like chemotaxis protein
VTVSDNGIGIAPEDRERIFDSFEQAGRARTQSEGTGLGLTLSRRIVERLGGHMWLESVVGAGSTFGFAIPLGGRSATSRPGLAETGPVVVIVEDDHRSLELLSLYLASAGVRPAVALDGAQGLAAVRELHPSAMILDIRLPGMDGWRVLEELKADRATASVPVVVITMLDERPKAMALGAAEYLIKPVGRDDVISALGRVGALPIEHLGDVVAAKGER